MTTSLRRHAWLLSVVALGAVLLVNTVSWHGATQLDHLRAPRRYWEDLAIATANYLDASHPRGRPERAVDEVPEYRAALQRRVLRSVDQQGIRFWELWRTVPMERFDAGPLRGRANDDPGRSVLSASDWLGLGPWRTELPLPLLWAPALLALAAVRRTGAAYPALMGSLAVAALGLPVIVTTAGAIETQAFVLVYYLGLGFVIDPLVRGLWSRTRMRAPLRARAPSAAAPPAEPPEGAGTP